MNHTVITILQTIFALLLIAGVLLQQRGTGLSQTFGGSNSTYSTRRGFERVLFIGTVIVAILFFISSILQIVL